MAKVIAISNQKGGVGKTTTTCGLAAGLKNRGYRTLLIDMDPQGNLSFCMGGDTELNATVYNVLLQEVRIQHAIQHTGVADIVCANILLSSLDLETLGANREYLLKEALDSVSDFYDYILIDTPPALSILTVNAFTAANSVVIPILSDIFSLQGIAQLYETIDNIRKRCNPGILIDGVLLTRFNKRAVLSRQVMETAQLIAQKLGTDIFDTKIRSNVSVMEAQASQADIIEYAPKSPASLDYLSFTDELLMKERQHR